MRNFGFNLIGRAPLLVAGTRPLFSVDDSLSGSVSHALDCLHTVTWDLRCCLSAVYCSRALVGDLESYADGVEDAYWLRYVYRPLVHRSHLNLFSGHTSTDFNFEQEQLGFVLS